MPTGDTTTQPDSDTTTSASDLECADRTHINIGGTRGGGARYHGRHTAKHTDPTKPNRHAARIAGLHAALAEATKAGQSAFASAFAEIEKAAVRREERAEKERAEREKAREERERTEKEKEREHQRWMMTFLITGKPPSSAE